MIPFAAGSSLDIVGRLVLDPLSSQLGQPVVVENRGGAGGTIGTGLVVKADPDGYTHPDPGLSAFGRTSGLSEHTPMTSSKDFVAISFHVRHAAQRHGLLRPPAESRRSKELVAKAKAGGSVTYASAGVGSATHLAAEDRACRRSELKFNR